MRYKYIKNVATLHLMEEECIGCGKCVEVCPHNVFTITDKKARINDRDNCMECGACTMNCPVEVISVEANVGCALAIIKGWLTGSEPSCDCSNNADCC